MILTSNKQFKTDATVTNTPTESANPSVF